ncbi:MAG: DUF1800 family protein, partial [Campylobacterota bacterium]|nr:DUF1800 family protein [Campylobacterota bacterium]
MIDYIVPILAAIAINNATPLLTTSPNEAYSDTTSIEVNGKAGNIVLVNGIEVGIIKADGSILIYLDTTESKSFVITLLDNYHREAKKVTLDINRRDSPSTPIPEPNNITDAMAYKFLNMATFGATPTLVSELRDKGVEQWLDDQLAMDYVFNDDSTLLKHMKLGLESKPYDYNRYRDKDASEEDYSFLPTIEAFLAPNEYFFFQLHDKAENGLVWNMSTIFSEQLESKKQVRQRVAYALSQTVIASESGDNFFRIR